MKIATARAEQTVSSLDDIQQSRLNAISPDRVNLVLRRIVDDEPRVPVLEVAAFNSAM